MNVMAEPKGDKLFVNVGASQARRRLKGFGHGVRKVHSAGRNQAVVIHTATGNNLRELEAKFADVGFTSRQQDLSQPIENLKNLGPTSCSWLREVGIPTIDALELLGPVMAYQLVKRRQQGATLNLLWALAAGLKDRDWRELSEAEKERLRKEAEAAGS
jgi:DNA transformation protein and related proteins